MRNEDNATSTLFANNETILRWHFYKCRYFCFRI